MADRVGKPVIFRQGVKRSAAALYRRLGAARKPGELVILNYHSIQPEEAFSTSPEMFARQLEYLIERFDLPSLDGWFERHELGPPAARPAALVSFDDGFENFFEFAFPILQRLKVPAVLFVTTGFVIGGCGVEARLGMYRDLPPLSWAQLKEVRAGGIAIGSHTHWHRHLGQSTPAQVAEELRCSKMILEDQLGASINYFAYPWGQRQHIGRETAALLQANGYWAACSALWGKNTASTNRYLLRRVRIDAWDTLEDFQAKVEGGWDYLWYYQMLR